MGLPSLWAGLRGQIDLGSDAFIAAMQSRLGEHDRLEEIPRGQLRPLAKPLARCAVHRDRPTAVALAYLSGDHTMKAIAECFGVHYSTVSRAVSAHEAGACRDDPRVAAGVGAR